MENDTYNYKEEVKNLTLNKYSVPIWKGKHLSTRHTWAEGESNKMARTVKEYRERNNLVYG